MTSEYTPDEEVVREFYVEGSYARGARPHEGADEFDRFIARVRAEAWDEGWFTAVEVIPGDMWFPAWDRQSNPYREGEGDE